MYASAQFLTALGGILLLGLMTSALGRYTFLPRVTLLLIFGAIIGNSGLDIIPAVFAERFEIIAEMALLMVGFLLGQKLSIDTLKQSAGEIFWISFATAVFSAIIVSTGLYLLEVPLSVAVLLGCIASATAPGAILDVVLESGYKGPFSDLLLSIVALDDAWALVIFALGLSVVTSLNAGAATEVSPLLSVLREVGGAITLGVIIGLPAAYLTGRIKPGQPMLTEALGIVFLCGGIAIWLDLSFLVAAMTMGAVIANLARHHEYPFHAIEGIEWPFMVIFFVLAGASLDLKALLMMGSLGIAYIVFRVAGKMFGVWLGASIAGSSALTRRWMSLALLPQAGVAIGMALVASKHFPQFQQTLLSITISTTIFFEIFGPVFTRMAIRRVAEKHGHVTE